MKQKYSILLVSVFSCLFYFSCIDYLDDIDKEEKYSIPFSVNDAKVFFENNATDLAPLSFSKELRSKASLLNLSEMYPEWKKSMISGHRGVTLIEVPLRSNTSVYVREINYHSETKSYCYSVISERRLIIAKRANGEIDMFVVTIIPDYKGKGDKISIMLDEFRYLGGGSFTGKVFCSTLEGDFVKAFGYSKGRINGTINTVIRSVSKTNEIKCISSIQINNISNTISRYSFGEVGNPSGSKCKHGYLYADCPYNCIAEGGDLSDVDIVACRYCNRTDGCICPKCFYCGQKENGCKCVYCVRCQKKIPECICYEYPDPIDPINPPIVGGGGATTNPSIPLIPDPCEGLKFNGIMDKILIHEGGYVNDPADPGKATNKGISWNVWCACAEKVLGVDPTLQNLKNITKDQAVSIYKSQFWDKANIDDINDPDMRYVFFDFYINAGGNATKVLQQLLNQMQSKVHLNVDGVIGSQTINCLNDMDHKILYNRFIEKRKGYYNNLVKNKPDLAKFLNGWQNRVNKFNQKTDLNKYNTNC